jgi:hypothetical protein
MIAKRKNQVYGCGCYDPTPQDIRRACEEIQATWSPRERARRYRGRCTAGWTPPMIRLRDLVEPLNEEGAGALAYYDDGLANLLTRTDRVGRKP